MKKILAIVLALAMILALAACGSSQTTPAAPVQDETKTETSPAAAEAQPAAEAGESYDFKVGYISADPSSGFWKEVLESLEAACKEKGIEFAYQIAKDTAAKRSAYDSLLTQGCDIIVDGYGDTNVVLGYADEAVEAGVPFVSVACIVDEVKGAYSYGTPDTHIGDIFGNFALNAIKEEWNGALDLIITCNIYTYPVIIPRTDNGVQVLKDNGYDDVEWVQIDTGMDTSTIGASMSATLLAHPDAKNVVIFGATDAFCPTIVNVLEDSGFTDKVIMISSDCTEPFQTYAKEHHDSGEWPAWYGSLDLQTSTYGYKLLDEVIAIMNGEDVPPVTLHSGVIVTAANVYDYFPA